MSRCIAWFSIKTAKDGENFKLLTSFPSLYIFPLFSVNIKLCRQIAQTNEAFHTSFYCSLIIEIAFVELCLGSQQNKSIHRSGLPITSIMNDESIFNLLPSFIDNVILKQHIWIYVSFCYELLLTIFTFWDAIFSFYWQNHEINILKRYFQLGLNT